MSFKYNPRSKEILADIAYRMTRGKKMTIAFKTIPLNRKNLFGYLSTTVIFEDDENNSKISDLGFYYKTIFLKINLTLRF
jgi:hypothetical protein